MKLGTTIGLILGSLAVATTGLIVGVKMYKKKHASTAGGDGQDIAGAGTPTPSSNSSAPTVPDIGGKKHKQKKSAKEWVKEQGIKWKDVKKAAKNWTKSHLGLPKNHWKLHIGQYLKETYGSSNPEVDFENTNDLDLSDFDGFDSDITFQEFPELNELSNANLFNK